MEKIDELILWYEQNSITPHDCMVSIELEKINSLYDRYKDHTNEIFVEEMIESFCKIIERQQEKAIELEENLKNEINANSYDSGIFCSGQTFGHSFMTALNLRSDNMPCALKEKIEDFQDDRQLQNAFTHYCLSNGTSSYTVNDYCSRIKKTWKSFEEDYKTGNLKENLASKYPEIPWDGILMNVYYNIETLCEYVKVKIVETEGNRNWLNARAALNKLYEFKKC
ncbi:MAG: hypothetical protein E7545_04540 [Ruminococcaceae bacterium]|nr:hypothetical protein [Oscillospiraceae bacterium]